MHSIALIEKPRFLFLGAIAISFLFLFPALKEKEKRQFSIQEKGFETKERLAMATTGRVSHSKTIWSVSLMMCLIIDIKIDAAPPKARKMECPS